MKKRNLIGSFSHNILKRSCSNVTFVTIAVFKFKLKHEGGKPHSFFRNTDQWFILERSCSNVIFVTIAVFKFICIKTHEKQTEKRETSQFFLKHTLAVHFVKRLFQCHICDYCCFQVDLKKHKVGKLHSFSLKTHQLLIL